MENADTVRFEPNRRLLRILVGSNLYGSPHAAVRELIQNAWDAIQWRKRHGDGSGERIEMRYSATGGWFEVVDDGYGMDEHAIRNSFLAIGEDKLDVLGEADRTHQIGYFGIGVLSIFLIAERFEVTTRRTNTGTNAIYFQVTGLDDPIDLVELEDDFVGTSIRVYPRADINFDLAEIPNIVRRYVRHVEGVYLHDVDTDSSDQVQETWTLNEGSYSAEIKDYHGVRTGRLTLVPALTEPAGTLSTDITICNSGFLVESDVYDLLPVSTLGLCGELNLEPHSVTMGMSRERIQRDSHWQELGERLQDWTIDLVLKELREGKFAAKGEQLDSVETKRALLLWYHFIAPEPPFSPLYEEIDERVYQTVPFVLAERSRSSLAGIFKGETRGAKLFFKQIFQPKERTQNIDDEGMPIRVSEEIRDSIRIGALRAKGYEVVELDRLQVNTRRGGTVRTQQIDEYPLVLKCLQKRGVQLVDISNASDADMDLRSIERLPILKDALVIAGGLRFASIPDSKRRIVTDHSGIKYINLRNQYVQKLLRIIPKAATNPLKNRILEAYLKIEDFKFGEAREILVDLLESDELEDLAGGDIAPLSEKHIQKFVDELMVELNA